MKKISKLPKKILSLFIAVLMVVSSMPFAAVTASAATNDMYLFAYFTGDSNATTTTNNTQAIRFATSRDGINFKALNNNEALLKSTLGSKNVRDPYLFKGNDGAYYIIATDLDASTMGYWGRQSGMIVWKSTDLVNWTNETRIDVGEIIGVDPNLIARAWAPEVIYDSSLGAYMVYFALGVESALADQYKSTTMYYMTTTDLLDQSKYSKPQQLYNNGTDSIDADIVKQNGTYYMFYKDEGQGTVSLATSNSVTGPYSFVGKFATSSTTGNIEGCEVYQVENNYYLIADRYSAKGKFAIYNLGTDLSKLTNKGTSISVTDGNPITIIDETEGFASLSARHGSVAKISYDEYKYIMQEIEHKTIHDEVYYNFDRDYSATKWDYQGIQDSSGFWYDLMTGYDGATKSGGSATYTFANANYVSLYGSNIFINDQSAKEIMAGNSWTVSYDYVCAESTGAAVFTLTSGPSKTNTDWIRINDDGDLLYHDGTAFQSIGAEKAFKPVEGVSYHIDIVYDGSKIYFYADGELIGTVAAANIGYDYTAPTNYISFGGSDGNKKSFRGAFSNIRFKSEPLSQSEIGYSAENAASLVYNYNQGTEYIDGRAYTTNASSQISDTYTNSKGKSMIYSVCAWINPGASVGGTNTIFQFGDGGTGSGKNYFEIDENGQYWYCWWDGNGTKHFYDGSGAFGSTSLKANTWYFLQVNIIPYKNSTKFIFYLNGVNTATLDGTTVASGNNFTGFDYNPIYFFNRTSMPVYYGSGNAHWSGDGSSYIDDVRVYNKTVNPTVVYTAAAAHAAEELAEYEQANALNMLKTDIDEKLTSDKYNGQIGYSVTAAADGSYKTSILTGYSGSKPDKMSNVLYTYGVGSSSPKSAESEAGYNTVYMQYGNMVFLYDGKNDMCTPVNFHCSTYTLVAATKKIKYVIPTSPSEVSIDNYWHTTSGSKTATYITGNDIYANNLGTDDCNNNKHVVFYSGTLKVTIPDTFTDNYKTISSVTYQFQDNKGKTGTVTMDKASISVVNYKPLAQIIDGTTKPNAPVLTNDGFYSFYKKVKENEDWLYTYESTKKYYEAVNNILQFDVTNYKYASDPSGEAQKAGKKISDLASAYKTAVEGLTPKTYNVSFTDINGKVTEREVTAGSTIGTFPSNTSIKYNNDNKTHTTYSWDTNLKSDSVVKSDINIVEKSTKSNCSFDLSATTEATCTAKGQETYTCSTCGGKYYETIEALGHSFVSYSAKYTSNQTYDSSKTYEHTSKCSRCDVTNTNYCTFGTYVTTVAPTETADGLETATCSTCSGTVTRPIPKLGATTYTISFYDKDGNLIGSASVEENNMPVAPQLPTDFVDSAGTHNFAWSPEIVVATANASYRVVDNLTPHTNFTQEVTAPTCTERGYTTYTCGGGCGYSYEADYVDALGHDYTGVDYVNNDNGTHSRACTRCDYTETTTCTEFNQVVVPPSCTEAGYTLNTCVHCGYSYKSEFTTATGHKPGTAVEENRIEPTCTENGSYDSVVYCQNENCTLTNKEYSRETISIPATGHSFVNTHVPATCTAEGYWSSKCSVCGEENDVIDYTFNANSECSTKYPSIAKGSSSTKNQTYEYTFTFDTQPSAPVEIVNMEVTFNQYCHKGTVNHAGFVIYDANGNVLYNAESYDRGTEQYNQKITVPGNYFKIVTNGYFDKSEDHILFNSIKVRPRYPALGHSEAYRDDNNSTDSNLGTHSKYCTRCNEVLATSNHDIVTSVDGNTVVANCSTCGFSKVISTQKDTYRITTGNLFNFAEFANSDSVNMAVSGGSSTVSTADNSITLTGIGDSYTYFSNTGNDNVYKIPVTPNKSYTIEFKATTTAADVMIFQPNADGKGSDSNYYNQIGYRFGHKVGLNTTTITPTSDYIFMRFGTQTTSGRIDYTKIYDIAVYETGATVEVASDVARGTSFADAVASVDGNAYLQNFCNWGVADGTTVTSNMNVTPVAHNVVTDPAVAATCTTDGLTEGSHCSICNTVLVAQQLIKAPGHTVEKKIENEHIIHTCTVCKEELVNIDASAYFSIVVKANDELSNTAKYTNDSRNALQTALDNNVVTVDSSLDDVNAYTTAIQTAITGLKLEQYKIVLNIYDETGKEIKLNAVNENVEYGTVYEMNLDNLVPDSIKNNYTVVSWKRTLEQEEVLKGVTNNTVTAIVYQKVTYLAFVKDVTPTLSDDNSVVATLNNKSNKPVDINYVKKGTNTVTIENSKITITNTTDTSKTVTLVAPSYSFYQVTGFKVNGKEVAPDSTVEVNADLVITPIYTPTIDYTIELADGIYTTVGKKTGSVVMGWDKRITVTTDDATDNTAWYYQYEYVENNVTKYSEPKLSGYGKTFSMQVTQNGKITYSNSSSAVPMATIEHLSYGDFKAGAISAVGRYYLPDGYEFVGAGVILKSVRQLTADDTMSPSAIDALSVQNNYLVTNSGGVYAAKTFVDNTNQYLINVTLNKEYYAMNVGAVTYVQYKETADGEVKTAYSDVMLYNYSKAVSQN